MIITKIEKEFRIIDMSVIAFDTCKSRKDRKRYICVSVYMYVCIYMPPDKTLVKKKSTNQVNIITCSVIHLYRAEIHCKKINSIGLVTCTKTNIY